MNTISSLKHSQLHAAVASLASLGSDLNPDARRSALETLGTDTGLLLRQILNHRPLMVDVASRSYRHVNHFDKIVLIDSTGMSGHRLTLHLWRPPYLEVERREELIHDHRFSFSSKILFGALRSHCYMDSSHDLKPASPRTRTELARIVQMQKYQYAPLKLDHATIANSYRFMGDAELVRSGETCHKAGTVYDLRYEEIHRVLLPEVEATCTLVLRGPRERPYSHVFNASYPPADTRIENRPMTVDQLGERLELIHSRIDC